MSDTFARAKEQIGKGEIEAWFRAPGAHWKGDEYYTLSPIRPDRGIGSFSISASKKVFHDFADGKGGDIIDLLAASRGVQPIDVARELAGEDATAPRPAKAQPAPAKSQPAVPPPAPAKDEPVGWTEIAEGEHPPFSIPPHYLTPYRTAEGKIMFLVARWNLEGGKKEIKPCFKDGKDWRQGLPQCQKNGNPRLMMPVDPSRPVVVVEGEKCWHVANSEYGETYSFTTWHGGATQTPDITGLAGCDVVLWPDNDEPGLECMKRLAARLRGVATRVRIVEVPDNMEKGWDIADAVAEGHSCDVYIESAKPFIPDDEIAPSGVSKDRPYTDLGNAERLVDLFGDKVRFNADKLKWVVWTGSIWDDSRQSLISSMYKGVIASLMEEANEKDDITAVAAAKALQSRGRIDSMLSLASREIGIEVKEADFDPDPMLLNCPNGVVDLRTGDLMPHGPEYLMSRMTRAEYDPRAEAPRFMRFLDEVFEGNTEVINMVQRWFGYSLTADMSAQSFMIFYGSGANGKSTLVELASRIMGEYSKPAPPDTFIMKQAGGVPNDIAALRGARLVLTTETETNARLAESKVKGMTGGDRISARFMRAEYFEFTPTWKIVISTNHRPRIQGSDLGIWRRIVLVPFNMVVEKERIDNQLPKKLWEERAGVLRWMVEGAKAWYADGQGRKGLAIPASIDESTQGYREDEDLVSRFVKEMCYRRGDPALALIPDQRVSAKDLYKAFSEWAQGEGEETASRMSSTAFGRALSDRGIRKCHTAKGDRGYEGIVPKNYRRA